MENNFYNSKGIRANILNIGAMDNTHSSKLIINIFFSFVEFEMGMIVKRTQDGKAIAKTKEFFKESSPKKYTVKQLDNALSMITVNTGNKSYNEVFELLEVSKSSSIRENNKMKDIF